MKFNILCNFSLHLQSGQRKSVRNFYEGKNLKPCLTKQLLSMFKLWCEWGLVNVINVMKVLMVEFVGEFMSFPANNKTVHCTAETISTLVGISGTFRWDDKKDKILLREV